MTEPSPTEKPTGKGRPTPKRSEAEGRRRGSVKAPKTRKEAVAFQKAQQRDTRSTFRSALRTGDERNLPPRDAGPVKRFVRDVVDARHNAGNYVLLVAMVVVVMGFFVRYPLVRQILAYAYPALLLWIIVDSVLLVRLVRRRVRAAFPDEDQRGLGPYAALRAFQIRRLRLPPPKVKLGARV